MGQTVDSETIQTVASVRRLPCERLEYGKFTDGSGMVDGTEHRRLASTREFPAEIARFCGPRLIGPAIRDNDARPTWAVHGTVLQPVCVGGRIIPVFARVRELPELRTSRRYQRATYAVAPPEASPTALMRAFDLTPLEEFVREETPRVLSELTVEPGTGPTDGVNGEFVNVALECILAGIPVVIRGAIDEPRFFELVDSVWWRLPPTMRRWLSAGWGVGRSLDGKLAISAGLVGGAGSASYDLATSSWEVPGPADAIERRLSRGYIRIAYKGDAVASEVDADRMRWIEQVMTVHPPDERALEWDLPPVREAFNAIGRAAWDAWRLDSVRRALNKEDWRGADPEPILKDLWCQGTPRLCVRLILAALASPPTHRVAARVLARWWAISPKVVEEEIENMPADAPALEVIQRARRVPNEVLQKLEAASPTAELDPLEEAGVFAALASGLQHLDAGGVTLHERILQRATLTAGYREFIDGFAWPLALAIDRRAPTYSPRLLERLLIHSPEDVHPALRQLLRLTSWEPPEVEGLSGVSAQLKADLDERVVARWQARSTTPAQRESLLEWALLVTDTSRLLVVEIVRASRAGAGIRSLTHEQVKDLTGEVVDGRLPISVDRLVAELVIRQLDQFLDGILSTPNAWTTIAKNWPASYRCTLGFSTKSNEENVLYLPEPIRSFREQHVERLLRFWCDERPEQLAGQGVASNLIALVRERGFNQPIAPIAWICSRLLDSGVPSFIGAKDLLELGAAARAARLFCIFEQRDRENLIPQGLRQLWSRYDVPGNVLLLVLMLFPEVDFKFSQSQEILLGQHRDDLRRHLEDEKVLHRRREQLRLAAAPFHFFDYATDGQSCPTTILWGAFRGVPLKNQVTPLKAVLEYYATGRRERLQLCEKYVEGMGRCRETWRVGMQLIDSFVEPLVARLFDDAGKDFLDEVRHAESTGHDVRGIVQHEDLPDLIDVELTNIRHPVIHADRRFVEFVRRMVRLEQSKPPFWALR